MRRRMVWILAVLAVLAALPAAAQFSRTASPELARTLATLRNLSSSSFQQVVWWARNPSDPGLTVPDWNNAEREIMHLKHHDRAAVLSWLTGNGRQALYARGATDAAIGGRRPIDGNYTPATPSPLAKYRVMQIASETMRGGAPPGGINVRSGFALVAKDGTKAIVCLSFTNTAPLAADSVRFRFALMTADGEQAGAIDFNRKGVFSPNIAIDGPANAQSYFDRGMSSRSVYDNCVVSDQGTAAMPLLQTRHVAFKVAGVTYADGSAWP